MRILVIGGGGREHALCDHFHRWGHEVFCTPGNPGIYNIARPVPQADTETYEALAGWAKSQGIDLTVVGPEQPLAEGVVDLFQSHSLKIFGPRQNAAQLESSKAFAKAFMAEHSIPTARYQTCTTIDQVQAVSRDFLEAGGVVLKPSGLTAGKGVSVCRKEEELNQALEGLRQYGSACDEVVVESLLEGVEASLLVLCDGKQMIPLLPSQDHKALLEGDQGPNTGGMGAYTPTPFVTPALLSRIQEEIMHPTQKGLTARGIQYGGVLYFGIMITPKGPQVLEFNCRFGDPETQAILPLLNSDLALSMAACIDGQLDKHPPHWKSKTSISIVLASQGYPGKFEKGLPISGLDRFLEHDDIRVFQAGTRLNSQNEVVTNGGRVLSLTATGKDLAEAADKAYSALDGIHFQGKVFRKDIGHKALAQEQTPATCL